MKIQLSQLDKVQRITIASDGRCSKYLYLHTDIVDRHAFFEVAAYGKFNPVRNNYGTIEQAIEAFNAI